MGSNPTIPTSKFCPRGFGCVRGLGAFLLVRKTPYPRGTRTPRMGRRRIRVLPLTTAQHNQGAKFVWFDPARTQASSHKRLMVLWGLRIDKHGFAPMNRPLEHEALSQILMRRASACAGFAPGFSRGARQPFPLRRAGLSRALAKGRLMAEGQRRSPPAGGLKHAPGREEGSLSPWLKPGANEDQAVFGAAENR